MAKGFTLPRKCPFFNGDCPPDCGAGDITDSNPALGQLPYPLFLFAVIHFPDTLNLRVPVDPFGDQLFTAPNGPDTFSGEPLLV